MAGSGEAGGNFGFDAVDKHAAADGGAGRNGSVEAGEVDHGVADRSASVEDEVGKVLKLFAVGAPTGSRITVSFADDSDDANFAFLKLFGHLDWNDVAAARGDNERRVFGCE